MAAMEAKLESPVVAEPGHRGDIKVRGVRAGHQSVSHAQKIFPFKALIKRGSVVLMGVTLGVTQKSLKCQPLQHNGFQPLFDSARPTRNKS